MLSTPSMVCCPLGNCSKKTMNVHDPKTQELAQGLTGPHAARHIVHPGQVRPGQTDLEQQAEQNSRRDAVKFKAAKNYSRRVKNLKIGLPVLGACFILIFIIIAGAAQFVQTPFGVAAIDLTNGKVVMDQPTLSGFTASDAAYEIVADRALQDLTDPKKVLLEKIGATLTLDDGNVVSVSANTGKFDVEGENLNLGAGVRVHMSAGYAAELESAVVDMKSGILRSEMPVFIKADIGEIRADRLEVRDNGRFILFENRVRMVVQPNKMRPQQ